MRPTAPTSTAPGAIYDQPQQTLTPRAAKPVGEWNDYEITVVGQTYAVLLNGEQVATFTNTDTTRGLASVAGAPAFIGLQTHTDRVAFRNIAIKPVP